MKYANTFRHFLHLAWVLPAGNYVLKMSALKKYHQLREFH
jgi:hypothetical protein